MMQLWNISIYIIIKIIIVQVIHIIEIVNVVITIRRLPLSVLAWILTKLDGFYSLLNLGSLYNFRSIIFLWRTGSSVKYFLFNIISVLFWDLIFTFLLPNIILLLLLHRNLLIWLRFFKLFISGFLS